jgi:polysaccharide deacetylase family protein (PEP-CTERM system associated)
MLNALSFDVEEYFQVSNFAAIVPAERWGDYASRLDHGLDRIVGILSEKRLRATFFVLGWNAERRPEIVRRLAGEGHEIASHGMSHRLVYDLGEKAFREEVRRSKALLEDLTGRPVLGYRAPSFSITRESLFALDVLAEEGYRYDSSIFPVHHPRYGIPDAPRKPHRVGKDGRLWEFPPLAVRFLGTNVPLAGGGYFRLLPVSLVLAGLRKANREGIPAMTYLHPWEFDPEQPRLKAGSLARFRHYVNLRGTEGKLRRLLAEAEFGTASSVLGLDLDAVEPKVGEVS